MTDAREPHGNPIGTAVRGVLGLIAGVVRLVTGLIALVLVLHIVLVILGANPQNGVTQLIAALADSLTLGLRDLFLLGNPTVQVIVSYGLPALLWLAIGAVIVRVLRLFGRPRSGLA
ncbi:hypothetical protein [Actinomycetospora sp.]|jgi:hypothetical protein|uniref:hypothetical protein n=1 Tax=Actinomycetospora sp. TaxID=1872135 RepID=UPI002F4113AF